MNLAFKDIRFNLGRFLLTVAGVGFLVTASVGMVGLYRGIIADALLVIDHVGADLWVVQGGRSGPFSESSSIVPSLDTRIEGLAGVDSTRRFLQFPYQFSHAGRQPRAAITGLDFPRDGGDWLNLRFGRSLDAAHFEAVADLSVGVSLGDIVRLGQDDYRIVGLTQGMVDSTGDGLLFVSINDAMAIAGQRTSEEVLLSRARATSQASGRLDAQNTGNQRIAAVLVTLNPAVDMASVKEAVMRWGDVNVLSQAEQRDLLLNQRLWRLRLQILAFTAVLLVVMAIIISLIIYTMTLEKLHQIAMLKLIGARNAMIISMIAQQAALIGVGGFAFGLILSNVIFPYFPRRIVMDPGDLAMLFAAVAVISGASSLFAISRALRVRAQEVLS
jgi:putative ABC transport system permease protein